MPICGAFPSLFGIAAEVIILYSPFVNSVLCGICVSCIDAICIFCFCSSSIMSSCFSALIRLSGFKLSIFSVLRPAASFRVVFLDSCFCIVVFYVVDHSTWFDEQYCYYYILVFFVFLYTQNPFSNPI